MCEHEPDRTVNLRCPVTGQNVHCRSLRHPCHENELSKAPSQSSYFGETARVTQSARSPIKAVSAEARRGWPRRRSGPRGAPPPCHYGQNLERLFV